MKHVLSRVYPEVRWKSDKGDAISTNNIDDFPSIMAMMAVLYCHSQSMGTFVVFVKSTNISAFAHP